LRSGIAAALSDFPERMNDRQQRILQYVTDNQRVAVAELAGITGVSVVTVRHDLNYLEQGAYLKREHGFAVAADNDSVDTRMRSNFQTKKSLAEYAASLIDEGETVFIENGSTNAILARLLAQARSITVITASVHIANLLRESRCEVILLGGVLQKRSESMVGPLARLALEQLHFSKAFIGIDGYHADTGFTGRDMMRAEIVATALRKCACNYVLTDSTKFGEIHPHSLGELFLIHEVITDAHLPVLFRQQLEHDGVRYTLIDEK